MNVHMETVLSWDQPHGLRHLLQTLFPLDTPAGLLDTPTGLLDTPAGLQSPAPCFSPQDRIPLLDLFPLKKFRLLFVTESWGFDQLGRR